MKEKVFLLIIILLSSFVRFYRLDAIPALNADEAAIGYNAYSLLETGKDEHGNPWPIHFQSFNDYKPGLYLYIVLPFVKMLGLNIWAVRIPSALMGVASVYLIFLLAKEILKNRQHNLLNGWPLFSALLLAFSPWHIHFSRGGWEANAATLFILGGLLFYLKAFKNKIWFVASCLLFIASLYTYHSSRVVVPLLVIGTAILNFNKIAKNLKTILLVSVLGLVLLLPLAKDLVGEAGISRASGVGLLADSGPQSRVNEQRGEHQGFVNLQAKILHNKVVNYSLAFLQNWTDHYWGEFLFLSGDDIQRNKVPETGQLHLIELAFVVVGLVILILNLKTFGIIVLWVIVAPFAAALTFQSPHALRAHNMVIPMALISSLGLSYLFYLVNKQKSVIKRGGSLFIALLLIWQIGRYLHMYYIHMPKEYVYSSQYGLPELARFLETNTDQYQKVIITDIYDQPYILLLFYLKYSPSLFQSQHTLTGKDNYGFSTVRQFGKFEFASIDYKLMLNNTNTMLVGTDEEIPSDAEVMKKIYGSNGNLYFEVVHN